MAKVNGARMAMMIIYRCIVLVSEDNVYGEIGDTFEIALYL